VSRRRRSQRGGPARGGPARGEPARGGPARGGTARGRPARGGREGAAREDVAPEGTAPGRGPYRIRPLWQVVILLGIFALATLIAELAGAANLGVALGIGQIAFGIALVVVLVKS
jgi:hypothetical protein